MAVSQNRSGTLTGTLIDTDPDPFNADQGGPVRSEDDWQVAQGKSRQTRASPIKTGSTSGYSKAFGSNMTERSDAKNGWAKIKAYVSCGNFGACFESEYRLRIYRNPGSNQLHCRMTTGSLSQSPTPMKLMTTTTTSILKFEQDSCPFEPTTTIATMTVATGNGFNGRYYSTCFPVSKIYNEGMG
jgi:hypothetical protein